MELTAGDENCSLFLKKNHEHRQPRTRPLWHFFNALNSIPRPSKKEEQVRMGHRTRKRLGLRNLTDEVGNVLIRKPATAGMENKRHIVLQSHLDMVCQKNADTAFDFDTQGIKMYVDGDWVRAEGTTLGADNGIGVATILAVLDPKTFRTPPLTHCLPSMRRQA